MSCRCVIDKLGTLLYPNNCDVFKTLTLSLHDEDCKTQDPVPPTSTRQASSTNVLLRKAANIINDMVVDEIKKQKESSKDLTAFQIMDSIQKTNPLLWDFICSCTSSVRERSGRTNKDETHTKTVRRFSLICMLLFTTNPTCDTTLHHLVAEAIEVCGGSRQLIRILNRLGVSVSNDTHDRLVTSVAEKQKENDVWSQLSPDTFTVASADNIDFLQSHAAVYCGDQSRSYHGTTIQVVQPIPSLTLSSSNPVPAQQLNTTALADQTNTQHQTVINARGHLRSEGLVTQSATIGSDHPTQPIALTGPTTRVFKRVSSSSPANSPHKHGPKRRRTMQLSPVKQVSEVTCRNKTVAISAPNIKLHQFLELANETGSKVKLNKEVFAYFFQKCKLPKSDSGEVLKPLREFMLPTPAQLADHDSSTIYYMEILDENADSEETMSQVAEILIEKFSSASQKWVILVGDGKTYEHLLKVKRLYGSALENLLIFPGDWHVLKNFQPVIMKAYYHAGLREIAKECGYRAETLNSLEKCSHFKRTHSFLMQVWEAMYLEMVHAFITVAPQFTDLLTAIEAAYNQAMHNKESTVELLLAAEGLIKDANALNEFNKFVLKQAEADDTWKLWSNFVFKDCFCYIALFLAIRTSNWDLRVWSLKSMAPLFSAYDRPCYQKLVPNHIQDIQRFPDSILKCFQAGGFTVKLKAGLGHAVALDEAHECCINRDMKMAVVRPTQAYLRKTTFFFSYRIKAQKQLASQLFPASETSSSPQQPTIMDGTATTKHYEENIEKMSLLLSQYALLPSSVESNRGIVNVFTGTKATPEQTHDLINARNLGEQGYINYVSHYLLQLPSVTEAPIRRKRLLSMAPIKATKRRTSHKEKEERDTIKYLRRRLAWCNQTGQKYDEGNEQYSLLPRALAEIDGSPHKGNKSKWTDKLQSRYNAAPFMSALQWIPEVVIIDAMFSINTNPLRQHKSITDYAMCDN